MNITETSNPNPQKIKSNQSYKKKIGSFGSAVITLRHGRSPVNLLHIFKTLFYKNSSGRLHLKL